MIRSSFLLFSLLISSFSLGLEPPPFAKLNTETNQSLSDYRVVLSGLKRQQAQTFAEKEQRLSGKLWSRTWLAFKGYELDKISQFFLSQLNEADILYQCQGRACGSSQFWANSVFEAPTLLGRDDQQRYFVALKSGQPNKLYVFYASKRHTGQIRFHLDVLDTSETVSAQSISSDDILQALKQDSGWLVGFYTTSSGGLDTQKSQVLIETLNALPAHMKQRLYLAVHYYEKPQMQDNINHSKMLALQFKKLTKLDVRGLGALNQAPDKDLKAKLRFVFWPRH